jgi:nucleotide-binding universal stress UspA family protein
MKNILVPTDFSDCALSAVRFAADIANKTDAILHFLKVMTPQDYSMEEE